MQFARWAWFLLLSILAIGLVVLLSIAIWRSPERGALFVEVLRTFLSPWVFVTLIFLSFFRKELLDLLKRVKAVGRSGVELYERQREPEGKLAKEAEIDAEKAEQIKTRLERSLELKEAELVQARDLEFDVQELVQRLGAVERERKYWMFEYLRSYLAMNSKLVLRWISGLPKGQVAESYYHELLSRGDPWNTVLQISERRKRDAILEHCNTMD